MIDIITGMAAAPNFETWSVPGHSVRIEYSAAVLDEIRTAAVDGYHRVPHGGVETGGILFGTQQKNGVRISAWRPVACEYTKGPSFLLSEAEEAALPGKLQQWGSSPELEGLEPVGWYRAHNRSEILLADADLIFFNRFFQEPWQIALIIRPAAFAPTRAGFFFREAGGDIRTQSSYREFVLAPVHAAAQPDARHAIDEPPRDVPKPAVTAVSALAPKVAIEGSPAPLRAEPSLPRELKPRTPAMADVFVPRGVQPRRRWPLAAAILLIAAAAFGFWLYKPSRGLSLSATDTRGQLHIAWDRTATAVERATGGSLEILDHGVRTEVKLSPADLRSGSISYARESGDVALRLMLYLPGSPPVTETTHFVKPGEPVTAAPAQTVTAPANPAAQPQAETIQARGEPPPVTAEPVAPKPVAPSPVVPSALPAAAKPNVTAFRAPSSAPTTHSDSIPVITPPPIDEQPVNPQGAGLPSVLTSAAPAPAMPRPPAPQRTAPASGRIVWTGKLPKDGRLVIQGNHASSGALSASLPARGLFVNAFPGELTSAGMTLYAQEPKYAHPLTEAPGPDNGWNRTTYTLDPKRAAAIKVVELPGPRNSYQLVLQGNSPKLSIMVLEWRAP